MAVRAKEYAPPACGKAGAISAIEKHNPIYNAVMTSKAISIPPKPPCAIP